MDSDQWLGVELRHLAALQAVAEEGSFGRAATRLGYTQSAVSQQIATLERLVGERLVERPGGPRPVSLTEAGTVLLRHAEGIVARLRAAQADMQALQEGTAGSLRVGTYQSVGARVLPEVMLRFSAAHPQVDVQLSESEDGALLRQVEEGDLDLTFIQLPLPDGPFEAIELLRDPHMLVVPASSPLASGPPPSLREVAEMPLISYRTCTSGSQVESQLRMRESAPDVVFRSDDNGTMQGMVAAGVGVALMPLLAVDLADPRTRALDMSGKLPPRVIGIAWHRDRVQSVAARSFIDLAGDVCAEIASRPVAAAS
ncbi:MAG TPA: LysR family transcriptional regulator [Gaiellales bacterium]|jgi:DNA-binding transcriptional LysR family regulator|nr:LysR family transcriptional regulator [Gaiellales bacterium]